MAAMPDADLFLRVAVALAAGMLIGLERGWERRANAEGTRMAGVRTFGLIGLLGAIIAIAAREFGDLALGLGFVAFAAVIVAAHVVATRQRADIGATTVVAALLTFALGVVAVVGDIALAAASAVITALLLGIKPEVHRLVARMSHAELMAVLQLLVMSVVLLPVLPDRGFGPWGALNPYELWWMVVLIAGLSFVGYVAVRLLGPRRGIVATALFGGLSSSTAVSLNMARLARDAPGNARLFAAGAVLASTVMMPRILIIVGVVAPPLVAPLAGPLLAAAVGGFVVAALLLRGEAATAGENGIALTNPFELGQALRFGVLLAAIMLAARALDAWLGERGVYLLALVSGLADVDAVSLSLSRMAGEEIAATTATAGILVAMLTNTAVKAALVAGIARGRTALYAGAMLFALVAGGAAGLALGITTGAIVLPAGG